MTASDWIALSASVIAAGGLVVSIISLVKSSSTEKRQAKLEDDQSRLMKLQIAEHERAALDREETTQRARLKVTLEPGKQLGSRVVVVTAHPDYGVARDVAIVPKDQDGEVLPVPPDQQGSRIDLEPGDDHRFPVILSSLSKGGYILVELEWIDPDGQLRRESRKAYRR